jgi:cytochrome c-type biogenesis protein
MSLESFLEVYGGAISQGGVLAVLGVALLAGVVASGVCPCTLPVGMGVAAWSGTAETQSRKTGLIIALAFFAGIVINLAILGAVAGRLGAILSESFGRYWALGMALLSLGAAALAFWGPRLRASQLAGLRKPGANGAFGYGFIFSLGTSAAPLALLLTVAAATGSSIYGVLLAFAFGVGRGLPFLLAGLFAGAMTRFVRLERWRHAIQVFSGSFLVLVSAYFFQAFAALL